MLGVKKHQIPDPENCKFTPLKKALFSRDAGMLIWQHTGTGYHQIPDIREARYK
jgi:hypothetical protein